MTRFLLFLSCLFFCVFSFSQTLIPDANFEQFLVDQGIDTNGITGDILNADAAAVTSLNITRNDIIDFTGLEAFVNVTVLNLGRNQVPIFPLTTLTLLEELRFERNDALTGLDLSQNVALRVLAFNNSAGTPIITNLDLSQNVNLEDLNIRTVRSITSLILPVTGTLTDINVAILSVPTIDLSQLTGDLNFRITGSDVFVTIVYPNLRTALKRLDLSSINFPTVDVSEMIGLEQFELSSTNTQEITLPTTSTLTSINISGHELRPTTSFASVPNLTNLTIRDKRDAVPLAIDISQNLELIALSLPRNRMVDLDISQNTKLTRVDVSTNNFTSIDVSQNLALTNINVSSNQLPSLDITLNTELNRLNAASNLLPTIDLSQNTKLRYLYLGNNQLPDLDITNNTALWILGINNNLFTGSGLDLSQNNELFIMNISNNQVETLDFSNTPMRNLDISYNIFPGNQVLNDFYSKIEARGNLSDVVLRANNNLLTGTIPDFYSIYTDNDPTIRQHRRWSLHIENNYFHFGDFENQHLNYIGLLTTQSIGPSPDVVMREYTYAPQEKVNTIETPTRNAGDNITLLTEVRGAQNHYKWFKDGIEITDAPDSPELVLSDLNTCDAGVYYTETTSDLVPFENSSPPGTNGKNLLLVRNDITLTVNATKECVTLDMPLTNVPINSGVQWNDTPGACGYKISVGTATGATDVANNEDVGEVTVYNFVSDLNPNQDYFVTITPYYDDGDFTCVEQSFRTNSAAVVPDCTLLSAPLGGSANVVTDLTRIEWNPANGADLYDITISSPSGANDITTTTTNTFLAISNDFNQGEIVTVIIIPTNTIGNAIGCTSESFTIQSAAAPVGNPFITTWKTDNPGPSDDNTIVIPTRFGDTYNYTVDWGDGNITTGETGDATHTYVTPGTYTVSITGLFPRIHFDNNGDREKLLTIEQWGDNAWTSMSDAFRGCSNLTGNFSDRPDLSGVTSMRSMFTGCSVFNSNINTWDVSTVTDMTSLFRFAFAFNQPLDNWDVSNVTNMSSTFRSAIAFNQNINSWVVDNVVTMSSMFSSAISFNQPLDNWNVANVALMNSMFLSAGNFNQDIGGWTTTSLENMSTMFNTALSFNQDIGNWDVSNVTNMGNVFVNTIFNQDISAWNTANVLSMGGMFVGASNFNQDIGNWDVGQVTDMGDMFRSATSFDQDLSNWNVENVTDAERMFDNIVLSTTNYDALLIGWNTQNLRPNVVFSGGNSQYCEGEAARANMIAATGDNWTITDGGNASPTIDDLANQNQAGSYTLPLITGTQLTGGEAYYTETNGGGAQFEAGDVINFTDFPSYPVTLYIYDGAGSCASEQSFNLILTTSSTPPSCTNLTGPSDGDTDIAVDLNEINWNAITGATSYRITIAASVSTLNNIDNLEITTGTTYTLPGNFTAGETVMVTIIPFIDIVAAVGCLAESFTIAPIADSFCTELSMPLNGATNVAADIPSISWGAIAGADGYKITVIGSISTVNNITDFEVTTGTSYAFSNDFIAGETVTVAIISFVGSLDATGCTSESFTIETDTTTVPECTILSVPANGAVDVPVDTDLSWVPVANAAGYRISVTGSSNADNNIFEIEVTSGTSYEFLDDFNPGETITVNITPYNSANENIVGCPSESFTIVTSTPTLPTCTTLISPLNEARDIATTANITWDEVENADGYRLSVGTTSGGTEIVNNIDVGILTAYSFSEELPEGRTIYITITPYNALGDAENCTETSFRTIETEDLTQYGFSPNGDGINEYWVINGIENYSDNTVSIYNRWGDLVFQIHRYDNQSNVFSGIANKKTQIGASELPSGTYFFNIQINGDHNLQKLKGFLVLKR